MRRRCGAAAAALAVALLPRPAAAEADPAAASGWDAASVGAWLDADLGLPQYQEAVRSAGITGAALVGWPVDMVLETLNVTRALHRAKLQAHLTKLRGGCPCNLPGSLSMWEVWHEQQELAARFLPLIITTPRGGLALLRLFGPDWGSLQARRGGAVWRNDSRPEDYWDAGSIVAPEDSGGPARPSVLWVLLDWLLLVAVPMQVIAYHLCSAFWGTNWALCIAVFIYAQLEQAREIFSLGLPFEAYGFIGQLLAEPGELLTKVLPGDIMKGLKILCASRARQCAGASALLSAAAPFVGLPPLVLDACVCGWLAYALYRFYHLAAMCYRGLREFCQVVVAEQQKESEQQGAGG